MTAYLKDPAEIYRRSFEIVRAETDFGDLPSDIVPIAARLVHACGMPDIVGDLRYSAGFSRATRRALNDGRPLLVDCAMVEAGVAARRLSPDTEMQCTLDDPRTRYLADEIDTTRSAAAVELWRPHLAGAVVVIGNAPAAWFHSLDIIATGADRPASIVGLPVGFVGAAESKRALTEIAHGVEYLTLLGRRGGSAMAAAAINAVLLEEPS